MKGIDKPMRKPLSIVIIVVVSFLIVASIWYASWRLIVEYPGFENWAERGSFGDMFGAVSALFSGLAFCGLIFTILLQVRQLAVQQRELEQARVDIAEQRKYLEMQSRTIELQRFETTFFQLLRFHQDTVSTMSAIDCSGRSCFRKLYQEFAEYLKENDRAGDDEISSIQRSFDKIYVNTDYGLDQYFGSLYSIVRFADQTKTVHNKEFYLEFVRAQLTNCELLLLFYHCLTEQGKARLKPLVLTHKILANLPREEVIKAEHWQLFQRR